MFSGGDYQEVKWWLGNFATSHSKREDFRAECALDTDGPREGKSYGLRVRLGERLSPEIELEFRDVAANRGRMAWCEQLAERVRGLVRDVAAPGSLRPA